MLNFKYRGFDNVKGKSIKGYIEAYTTEEAQYKLKEDNIEVELEDIYEVDEESFEYKMDTLLGKDVSGKSIRKSLVLTFTEQLSMHLGAKLPVSESLYTMSKDSTNKSLEKLYKKLYEDTSRGLDLSEALKKHSVFDEFFITIVRSGEQSGKLDEALESLNEYIRTNQRLKNRLLSAAIYPALLVFFIVGALIAMSFFVIPTFQGIFEQQGAELNFLTIFYFNLADFIRFNPILTFMILGGIGGAIAFYVKSKIPIIVKIRDNIQLRNPAYNMFFKQREIAQFAFTLSVLMKNGIILTDALEMSMSMFKNQYVAEGLRKMHRNLMQGNAFNQELKDFKINKKQFLPVLFIQLATVGEATGNMEEPFKRVGDYFFTQFNNKAGVVEKMMEPVFILVLIPIVATFVIAIFLPMITVGNLF